MAADEEKNYEPEGSGKNKQLLLSIIIGVVSATVISALFVFLGFRYMIKHLPNNTTASPTEETQSEQEKNEKLERYDEYLRVTANPADSKGRRFVVVQLSVEFDSKSKDIRKELMRESSKLQDVLNLILSNKTTDELEGSKREELRKEILDTFNENLKGNLTNIYFTEFMIQ